MLARIKRETQPQQNAADEGRLEPLRATATLEHYTSYLARVYGFDAPVEAALGAMTELSRMVDLRWRSQVRLLKSDLAALGIIDPTVLPHAPVPSFTSVAEALGWMYVIEQSAAVHGQLRRHFLRTLPQQVASAGCYLIGGERAVGTRLSELGAVLDEYAHEPEIATMAIDAARAGFRCQRVWFNYTPPSALLARSGR